MANENPMNSAPVDVVELRWNGDETAPRPPVDRTGAWVHIAITGAIHAALLMAGAKAALAAQIEDPGPDVSAMAAYLAAAEERSTHADEVTTDQGGSETAARATGRDGNGEVGGGQRHEGTEGKAGNDGSRAKNRHFSAPEKPNAGDAMGAAATSAEMLEAARNFGMAGLLGEAKDAPFRVEGQRAWGADDPFASAGGLLGRIAGESLGTDGLGLTGIGEGGGGTGLGIGLGTIGTIGHSSGQPGTGTDGAGTSNPFGQGFGCCGGRWGHGRPARRSVRGWGEGGWRAVGRLPPEAVRRVIRQNFGRFRACYQAGLLRNPALAGRVTTSFVIGRDGSVSSVSNGGSDLPDSAVTSCVVRAFYGLSFPQPEGGIVMVTYPIVFSPE